MNLGLTRAWGIVAHCAKEGGMSLGSASALWYILQAVLRVTQELVIVRSSAGELVRLQ